MNFVSISFILDESALYGKHALETKPRYEKSIYNSNSSHLYNTDFTVPNVVIQHNMISQKINKCKRELVSFYFCHFNFIQLRANFKRNNIIILIVNKVIYTPKNISCEKDQQMH